MRRSIAEILFSMAKRASPFAGEYICRILLALFASAGSAYAQDLTWDVNGAAAGTGGTGPWNTTSTNWFNGAAYQTWNNAALDNAIFAGTAGNVTLGTPITVHDMTFNVGGYLFPAVGSTPPLTFGGVNPTITTNVGTTVIFSAMTGSTGFTKNGAGTLQLGGTSVGYTGVTTLNQGTLVLSSTLALGFSTAASQLVLNNGTTLSISTPPLAYNYTLTGGTVNIVPNSSTWSGAPTLTAPTTLILSGSNQAGTLSGNLADTGANILSLTRNGTGRVTLSGNNSYTGATTVTRGELQLGSAGALSAGSNLVFNGAAGTGGAIVLTSGSGNLTRSLGAGAGQVQWLGDGGFKSSGIGRNVNLGGAGAMLTWGTGGFVPNGNRLILGTNSNSLLDFQNGIDLTGGVRSVQGDGGTLSGHALMSGILSGTGGLNQVGNGFLELAGTNTYTGGTTITSGTLLVGSDANMGDASGALTFNGGTLQNSAAFTTNRTTTLNASGGTFLANANLTSTGVISGTGRLTKTGTSTLTLTGANNYSGGTTIGAGTLEIGNGGTSGSIVGNVIDNGILAFNRSNTAIFSGAVSGTGSLNQRGTGITVLSGTNTHTGGTTISAGTLQIGNGGTSGSVVGDIVDNGVLAFNRSDTLTFDGIITGAGEIDQRGSGTTILSGTNTYIGGTTISAGTLQIGNGGTSGSIMGDVTDNGVLAFARSDGITFGGLISGGGSLEQHGTGTLTLTGDNSYTGGTVLADGILSVASDGNLGAASGQLTFDGGMLQNTSAFTTSRDTTINASGGTIQTNANLVTSGTISGSGRLTKTGTSTLTLTGANNYSGGTTISAGTLQIGNGGTSGSVAGDIVDNGVLAFNRSDALIFDGIITGAGEIDQRGSGTLALTGNSAAFAGATSVTNGTLVVNGALGGTIDVLSGGLLQGTGTVGSTHVASGGTLAAGDPFGTFTVAGDLGFAPGSIFEIKTDPAGVINLLHATGTATINGGTVNLVTEGISSFVTGTRYTLLTGDAGRTGIFETLTEGFLLLDMNLAYDENHVYLDVERNSETLCGRPGVTMNQCSASQVDVVLGSGHPLVIAVRNLPDLASIQSALDQLTGEIHASTKSAQLEDSRYIRDAVTNRLRQASATEDVPMVSDAGFASSRTGSTGKGNVWGHVFGSSGYQKGNGNAARTDSAVSGFFAGADRLVGESLRLGVATGYSESSYDVGARASSASSSDYHLALYGSKQWGALGLGVGTAYTLRDIDTDRGIDFPGFSGNPAANYNSHTTQWFGEAGYALPTGNLKLEPFAQLARVNLSTDGYSETGTQAALNISKSDNHITYTTMGLHTSQKIPLPHDSGATVNGTLGWRRAMESDAVVSTHSIINSPTFNIVGAPITKNALVIDVGVDTHVTDNADLGISYNGQISPDGSSNGARVHFTLRF